MTHNWKSRMNHWKQGSIGRFLLSQLTHTAITLSVLALLLLGARQVGALDGLLAPAAPNVGNSATTINYQGRLADESGTSLNGQYDLKFAIYDAAEDGAMVWPTDGEPELHEDVTVSDGLFSVGLGSRTTGGVPTSVWSGDRYLQVWVESEELAPRELLRSVPIAGMALTVPDGAIEGRHLAAGFGASNKPLLNFVPAYQRALRLEDQSDLDWTTVDLAEYTSSTTTHVLLWVALHDTDGIGTMIFEGNGEEFFRLRNFSTSTWTHDHIMIAVDSTQAIHYHLDAAGTNSASFQIYVIGYWEPVKTS